MFVLVIWQNWSVSSSRFHADRLLEDGWGGCVTLNLDLKISVYWSLYSTSRSSSMWTFCLLDYFRILLTNVKLFLIMWQVSLYFICLHIQKLHKIDIISVDFFTVQKKSTQKVGVHLFSWGFQIWSSLFMTYFLNAGCCTV